MAKKEKVEEPKVDNTVEKIKVKKPTVKKFQQTPEVVKVDLKELAKKAEEVTKVDESVPAEEIKVPEKPIEEVKKEEEKEKVKEGEVKVEETPLLEEITNEEEKEPVKTIEEPKQPKIELPENIQKVVEFMKDTGGDLNDYVQLNRDYNNYDNDTLLREYYRTTKPHLQDDEINFLMEDQFSYDEELREIYVQIKEDDGTFTPVGRYAIRPFSKQNSNLINIQVVIEVA